jgi:hypothetical protein
VPYCKSDVKLDVFLLFNTRLVKGIVSRGGVSTETIAAQFRPKQPAVYVLHLESHAQKIYDATNGGSVYVIWLVLEFSHLLSSAIKCIG